MDNNPFQDTDYGNPAPKKPSTSKKNGDLKLIEKVNLLLETGDDNEETSSLIIKYTKLHRVHENTKARRRLEKWASIVIVIYLIVVLAIVLINYISIDYEDCWLSMITIEIPDKIMFTILSTTTVNIIGLGLIVLRGHFPNKEDKDER